MVLSLESVGVRYAGTRGGHAAVDGVTLGLAAGQIGVLIGPYEAGPYVEGGYEVTLPVTAEVLAVVKPEYRASFAAGR